MHLFPLLLAVLAPALALAQAKPPATAAFLGTPQAGQLSNGWKYMGCVTEVDWRALPGLSFSDDKMTIEKCQTFCVKNNFILTGVEYGREYIRPASKFVAQKDCNMACGGNSRQWCRGNGRVSVFNMTTFAAGKPPATVGTWAYQSCYMEPQNGRALDVLVKADDGLTIPACTQACQGAAFAFAGLEYGRECWCGNTKSPALEDASDPQCEMQCDMPCGGNPAAMCGGRGAIAIYKNTAKKRGLGGRRAHESQGGEDDGENGDGQKHGPSAVGAAGALKGRFVKVRRTEVKEAASEAK